MKCNNTLCKRHLENGECVKLVGEECKLEQAKEIIKNCLRNMQDDTGDMKPIIEQAEQFLKE